MRREEGGSEGNGESKFKQRSDRGLRVGGARPLAEIPQGRAAAGGSLGSGGGGGAVPPPRGELPSYCSRAGRPSGGAGASGLRRGGQQRQQYQHHWHQHHQRDSRAASAGDGLGAEAQRMCPSPRAAIAQSSADEIGEASYG